MVDCSYEIPNKVRVPHWQNERLALNTHFRGILTNSLQRNQTYSHHSHDQGVGAKLADLVRTIADLLSTRIE